MVLIQVERLFSRLLNKRWNQTSKIFTPYFYIYNKILLSPQNISNRRPMFMLRISIVTSDF